MIEFNLNNYQSQDISELAGALAKAQKQSTFALKDATAPSFGGGQKLRKYASLQAVLSAIKAPLADNGLSFVQTTLPAEDGIAIRTVLMHTSGQWISGIFLLPADRQGGIQGLGSSVTYARRYALSAMVGICADDDDDGEASKQATTAPKSYPRNSAPVSADTPEKKRIGEYLWQVGFPTVYPDKDAGDYSDLVFNVAKSLSVAPMERPTRLYGYELSALQKVEQFIKERVSAREEKE